MGSLEGIFRGFFLTHRTKAQTFRGKFRSIFRTKIRGSKKIFRAKFTLRTCHLNFLLTIGSFLLTVDTEVKVKLIQKMFLRFRFRIGIN